MHAPLRFVQSVLLAACLLSVFPGCVGPGAGPLKKAPPIGLKSILEGLESSPAPNSMTANKNANYLDWWARRGILDEEYIQRVMKLVKNPGLAESTRMILVEKVLLDHDAKKRNDPSQVVNLLPELKATLARVDPPASGLADQLAAAVVEFGDSYENSLELITTYAKSPHVTLRYGCVDLMDVYFEPDVAPQYLRQIVDILAARVRLEEDPAVAELACKALGEIGVGKSAYTKEVKDILESVSNDVERKFTASPNRHKVPRSSAEKVRAMAVKFDPMLREKLLSDARNGGSS